MPIECAFFGPFREAVGERRVELDADAETVGELLAVLESRYPDLEGRLLDESGDELAGQTVVTRGRTNVRRLAGLETPVEDGATYRLTPSVYGG